MSGHTFTLDTSGAVRLPETPFHTGGDSLEWPDLAPFTQGYVEAAMRDLDARRWAAYRASCEASPGRHLPVPLPSAFKWLAPETLAAILKDCASKVAGTLETPNAYEGRRFWERRLGGEEVYFPPLTPYLDDDGKVCLRAAILAAEGKGGN